MTTNTASIRFVIGSRKLFEVRRRLTTVGCNLEQLIAGTAPDLGADDSASDGYRLLSVPETVWAEALQRFPRHLAGGLQRYRRHYIDMSGSFSAYLSAFSSKTRSTFNRKRRKLAELSDGEIDVQEFRTPAEIGSFFDEAAPLSQRTYQARLLDAGLPESDATRRHAMERADRDALRAFLLRAGGRAIAYLYLPVEGATLTYAFLGYDPEFGKYSPGSVLQLAALERLFEEKRYRYFDFTEGEGDHKALFGTDAVEACSFLLLRSTVRNRLLLGSLGCFDGAVKRAKRIATQHRILANTRRILRS